HKAGTSDEGPPSSSLRFLLLGLFDYVRFSCVPFNRINPVFTRCLCLVRFSRRYYLTISRLQPETILAGLVLIQFKLWVLLRHKSLFGLVFNGRFRSVSPHTLNSVLACGFRGV